MRAPLTGKIISLGSQIARRAAWDKNRAQWWHDLDRARPSLLIALIVSCSAVANALPASAATVGTQGFSTRLNTASSSGVIWLDVASSEDGLVFAAWGEYNGGLFRVYASRFQPGEGWSESRPVGLGVDNESFSEVAVGPEGYAFVSWNTFNLSAGSNGAFVAVFSPTDGWSAPFRLSAPGRAAVRPAVAAGSGGTATVVWPEDVGANRSVFARAFSPASGWSIPVQLSTEPSRINWVDLSVAPDGRALAVWIDQLGVDHLNSSAYSSGAGWSIPSVIATGVTGSSLLVGRLAISAATGRGVVAWIVSNDAFPSYAARAALYDSAAGWGTPTLLSGPTTQRVFPNAGIDDAGLLHVAFLDKVGGVETLYERVALANGSWGARALLSSSQTVKDVWLASSTGGGLVAVWIEPDGLHDAVRARRFLASEGWGPVVLVAPEAYGNARSVVAAADRDGNTVVAWNELRGATDLDAFAVWLKEPLPPPLVVNEPAEGEQFNRSSARVAGRTEPSTVVWANGVAATADENGNFSALVPLIPGDNTITVEAVDKAGNRNSTSVTVVYDDPLPSLESELGRARADLNAALANLSALRDALNSTGAALDLARTQLDEAEANLTALEANASVTSDELDQARADLDAARLRVTQLEVNLSATRASLASAQTDLDEAFLRIASLESDRQRLERLAAADNTTAAEIATLEERLSETRASLAFAQLVGFAGLGVGALGLIAAAIAVVVMRRQQRLSGP